MPGRHDEGVTGEQGRSIEERDRDVVAPDLVRRLGPGDHAAERALRIYGGIVGSVGSVVSVVRHAGTTLRARPEPPPLG